MEYDEPYYKVVTENKAEKDKKYMVNVYIRIPDQYGVKEDVVVTINGEKLNIRSIFSVIDDDNQFNYGEWRRYRLYWSYSILKIL